MFKRIVNVLSFIIKIALIISFVGLLFILVKTDIFPFKYFLIFIFISIIILGFNVISDLFLKKELFKIISIVLSIILIIIYFFIYFYISKTDNFINGLSSDEQLETYYIGVLENSSYESINDLANLNFGSYYNNEISYNQALKKIDKEITYNITEYNNLVSICNHLKNGDIQAILVNEESKNIIEEKNILSDSDIRYIYDITIKTKVNVQSKDLDVTKQSFIVDITGIDISGDISNVARSDVNIIAVVNPKIKKILLISIPRDYFVQLHGTTGRKDLLTHSGFYGVDMTVSTLEDLLGIDINYYIRLNFSTLVSAIDVIGGVDVYSPYTFNTYGYQFYEGYNTLNGEYALAFSRARKNFVGGDKVRGKNQMQVIEAIIKKLSTSSVLLNNYLSILESLNGSFQTNISSSSIYDLVKMQLTDMSGWDIEKYSLDGINGHDYTYSLGDDILAFVMEPDYNTVNIAKEKINEMMQ